MMQMKRILHCLVLAIACVLPVGHAIDFADMLMTGKLWEINRYLPTDETDFLFVDTDENSSVARDRRRLMFGSIQLGEVVFDWKKDENAEATDTDEPATPTAGEDNPDAEKTPPKRRRLITPEQAERPNKLARITCMVYSKGDDDELSVKDHQTKQKELVSAMNSLLGQKARKSNLPGTKTGLKVQAWVWSVPNGIVRLESAISSSKTAASKTAGKQSEFIRIVCAPDKDSLNRGGAHDKVGRRDLKSCVVEDADGTVWIKGIPMIDQGGKGYCVPATVARVFAYYGMDGVDMHAMAAICDSSADGGTSVWTMKSALKEIGGRFRVRIKDLPDPATDISTGISNYNREAEKCNKPLLNLSANSKSSWLKNLDPALWLKARVKNAGDVKKWMAPIRKSIMSGVPVLWSVFASGLYTSSDTSSVGGAHMRLIIGFNPKSNTIVYSDSWGQATTKRVMSMEEAYAATSGASVLQP